MDTDITEPVPIATSGASRNGASPKKTARPVTPIASAGRPVFMVASAGLGAVLAAIVVLVWAFSSGPQSVQQELKPESAASPATAQPAALTPPEPPADPGGLPAGLPAGLTEQGGLPAGLPAGLTPQGAAGGSPLAAFTPRPSVISGGGGSSAALPALPQWPAAPDLQTVLDTAAPYVLPALGPSIISGDAIAGLISSAGGWATAAAVATANNATSLLGNLILASAYSQGNGPIEQLVQASQGVASLASLPGLPGLPTPEQAFNLPAQLAVSLPALDALSKLPAPQIGLPQMPAPPPIGLPQFPIGMPQIGLPPPPPIGMPQIGLAASAASAFPCLVRYLIRSDPEAALTRKGGRRFAFPRACVSARRHAAHQQHFAHARRFLCRVTPETTEAMYIANALVGAEKGWGSCFVV